MGQLDQFTLLVTMPKSETELVAAGVNSVQMFFMTDNISAGSL